MSVKIITGYTGERHITPYMDAAANRGVIGNEDYILASDGQLEASMPSINQFVMQSGVISIQGHLAQVTGASLAVDTCATGSNRIDLVVARFTHNSSTLIDAVEILLIKGEETTSAYPITPDTNSGSIADGATTVDMILYKITLSGSTVSFKRVAKLTKIGVGDLTNPTAGMWKDARDNAGIKIPDNNSAGAWSPAMDMKSANYDFSFGVYQDRFFVSAVSDTNYAAESNERTYTFFDPANKVIDINGMKVGANQVLWTGSYMMTASHVANLNKNVSAQANGIVLVFSAYSDSTVRDYFWVNHFIPKWIVSAHAGAGVCIPLATPNFTKVGCKYLHVYNNRITGESGNNTQSTASGITFDNHYWVLRAVIGV